MADNHSKEVRSINMSHIRSTNSKPEEIVRKYLFAEGFRYRKNVKKLPGCPDIVLPKYKTDEFKVQGLEIDYSLLAWDADLRRSDDDFDYFKFRGTRWNHVNNLQQQKYLKNAYRVLMTRARQGVVIFIPEGVDPEEDSSRSHFYYDDIYKYLRSCGIIELE